MGALDKLTLFTNSEIAILPLVINFVITLVLSFSLKWFYIHYGHALSNRRIFSSNFPIIAATTFLVITVVKSSLALSLGLVGALSIVRFRAPIKEPEELAYLFLTIAIGLGIGAGQILATCVIVLLILFIVVRWQKVFMKTGENHNLYLNVEVMDTVSEKEILKKINSILKGYSSLVDIRRVDSKANVLNVTYYVDFENNEILVTVLEKIKKSIPKATLTFIDQDREVRG